VFFTSALDGGEWPGSRPDRFLLTREITPSTYLIRGWVGPRADLDAVAKRELHKIYHSGNVIWMIKPWMKSHMTRMADIRKLY